MDANVDKKTLAYIIGVALGDGNLSRPNGRATRLRITCDARYPEMAEVMMGSLSRLLPDNRVSIVKTPEVETYFNISVYSNMLDEWMPWRVNQGSKEAQSARVPEWVRSDTTLVKECLRGLLQTDGSIYRDRGYLMVNFCNNIRLLAQDVYDMLALIGFKPTMTSTPAKHKTKYTVRLARDADDLIENIGLFKS